VCDPSYSSKMLLDDSVAARTHQHQPGILRVGKDRGATHEQNEIYYVLAGEAVLRLDEEWHDIQAGTWCSSRRGVPWAGNKSQTDEFILLTFWERQPITKYGTPGESLGKSFKTIDED